MKFTAPEAGEHNLTLIFVCDSYLGCDEVMFLLFFVDFCQYIEMKMKIMENLDETEEEDDEIEEEEQDQEITIEKTV